MITLLRSINTNAIDWHKTQLLAMSIENHCADVKALFA